MSSRRGKHSLKQITCRSYEGASASQKIRSAEWCGALGPTNSNHASSSFPSSYQSWNAVDYNKPWFQLDASGEYKCLLCNAYATEGHVASDKHVTRSANPESYLYGWGEEAGGSSSSRDRFGGYSYNSAMWDEPWFEKREGEYYCLLCWAWATETHITCAKHLKRVQAPNHWGFCLPNAQEASQRATESNGLPRGWTEHWSEEHRCTYYHNESTEETTWDRPECAPVTAGAVVPCWANDDYTPPEYDFPYFEKKENGEFYCNLCGAYATHGHLESKKHLIRAADPGWWGYPTSGLNRQEPAPATSSDPWINWAQKERQIEEVTQAAETVLPLPAVPAPWEAYWSEEHNAYYFHNKETEEVSWDKPV